MSVLPSLSRRFPNAEDNVLPLINVVFLLLIFFMIAGTVVKEPPFALAPPVSQHAPEQDAESEYLAIGAEGQLAWRGETIPREDLAAVLERRSAPAKPLPLRADMNLDADELSALLADLREAGVSQVRLLTVHDD